jgi:hypothetical protein
VSNYARALNLFRIHAHACDNLGIAIDYFFNASLDGRSEKGKEIGLNEKGMNLRRRTICLIV